LDHAPVHLAFSGRCEPMKLLAAQVTEQMGSRVKVFCTIYPKKDFALVDIVHPNASKGAGVAAAASELGFTRDEVMACGDNHNDLEMLHFAGTPVVMENAEPELLEIPGFHMTASNDADGVAIAVERFILNANSS
jgi:hydroxymethylpyrimidine pyrophosphatase-like HAD family hydrolase